MFELNRRFFALPLGEKLRYERGEGLDDHGYCPIESEKYVCTFSSVIVLSHATHEPRSFPKRDPKQREMFKSSSNARA